MRLAPRPHSSDVFYQNGDQGIGWVFIAIMVLHFIYKFWIYGRNSEHVMRIRILIAVLIVVLCGLACTTGHAAANIHEHTARFVEAVFNDDSDAGYELMKDEYMYRQEFDEYFAGLLMEFGDADEYALVVSGDIHTFDYETRKEYLGSYHLVTDKGNYKVEAIAKDNGSGLAYFSVEPYDGDIGTGNIISGNKETILAEDLPADINTYDKIKNTWNVIALVMIALSAYDCFKDNVKWKPICIMVIIAVNPYLYKTVIPVGVILWRALRSRMIISDNTSQSVKLTDDLFDAQNGFEKSRRILEHSGPRAGWFRVSGIIFAILDNIKTNRRLGDIERFKKRRNK